MLKVLAIAALVIALPLAVEVRPRARDLGIAPGRFAAGPLNAITDVGDVRVGHVTLVEGDSVRTGVTAIVPHGGNVFQDKVAGAVFVGNAFGKLAGSTQVDELGTIETPIVLTNTLAVGVAVDAVVRWTIRQPGNEQVRSVNAVVGETNDGFLNDIRALRVTTGDVTAAIERAAGGAVEEGGVGAGTGTVAFGWKGGIGSSSRVLPAAAGGYRVGVLVQTNYGGNLTILGLPAEPFVGHPSRALRSDASWPTADGSCLIVVATDAPLDARDLKRLAARAVFGLGRTGSSYSQGSGDFAIAFTSAPDLRVRHGDQQPRSRTILPADAVSPLFEAVLEATEEAVYNSLLRAGTTTGNGRTARAIDLDGVKRLVEAFRTAVPAVR